MFELKQLRCFVAVASELNFRRAAERLDMTQPPLTRQVQLLEHQLGVRLLERSKRAVSLTAAGRTFLHEAQDLLERAEQAGQTARKVTRGEAGAVTLGFISGAVYGILPRVVADMRHRHPGIDLTLREMSTLEQREALRSRRIELGIVRSSRVPPGLTAEGLVREPFVLAVPSAHPLARESRLDIGMLDREPFILYSLSGWQPFYELLTGAFRSAGIEPDIVQHIGSTLTILSLVNAGLGLALVPSSAAGLGFDGVVYRRLEPDPGIWSELHLIWREDDDNPAVPVLRDTLRRGATAL